jgi:two-component system LytT family sensor kinase
MSQSNQPILRQRSLMFTCAVIFSGWAIVQFITLFWYEIPYNIAIIDSLISAATITAACYVVANALHYYQPGNEKVIYILVWVLSLSTLSIVIIRYGIGWSIPNSGYKEFVDFSILLRFLAASLLIGWMALMNVLWNIQQNNNESEKRKMDAEKIAREAELYNLRQQLQPHFLFNSLNSVIALISTKPEQARTMVFQLSDFLRGTLHKDDQKLLALNEELEHLQLYLDIEKVRFGHRLNVGIHIDEASKESQLPAMIVQPLLENAIKYGLYDTIAEVNIEINVHRKDNMLQIKIKNPFDPENINIQKSSGFGLRSIERRLFLIYGRTDLLQTHAEKDTFTATISIPQ